MLLADGRTVTAVAESVHSDRRQMTSHFPSGASQQFRYNGVPLITYGGQKKKKKSNAQQKHTSRQNHQKNLMNHQSLWEDYYRCMEYVGEPLMLVPRSSSRVPQFYHHPMAAYASYPFMNYTEYYQGTSPQQTPLQSTHHRDSFSSCSSSDTASSGSASPIHFSSWDSSTVSLANDVQLGSPKREWIHKTCQDVPEVNLGITLRIMTYNILAEQYASKKQYSYCPAWALNWAYRKEKIREEIELHCPDVACLQEVTMAEFYQYFLDTLRIQGYNGIFSPKSRANTMDTRNRQIVDGCAVIFRSDRFELVFQHLVEFSQLAIQNADGSNDMINRVMTKDNIALCAVLRVTESISPSYVLVVNVHVHWDPECSDVKLIQTMLLMCEVEKLVEKAKYELNVTDIPLIFCGDLNSLPNSGVVDFIQNGRVSVDHADFRELPYRSCLQKLSSQGHVTPEGHFFHPFALASTYDEEDMAFTNFTPEFKGVIDYIFVSRDKIHTLGVLGPIENTWTEEHMPVGFPCHQVASDHLPLVAEIELIL